MRSKGENPKNPGFYRALAGAPAEPTAERATAREAWEILEIGKAQCTRKPLNSKGVNGKRTEHQNGGGGPYL